jgi:hypothetical protein
MNLELHRGMARDRDSAQSLEPLAEKPRRLDPKHLGRASPRHLVLDRDLDRPHQKLAAELRREVVRSPPGADRRRGFLPEADHHDLREAFLERELSAERLDLVLGPIAIQDEPVGLLTRHRGTNLEHLPETPEAEKPDSVLALGHEMKPLPRSERALAAVADVGRDVAKSVGSVELGDDTFAVVLDLQARDALLPHPDDADVAGVRVQAVLDQLREGLSRIGLAQGEPPHQLERVVDADAPFLDPRFPRFFRHRGTLAQPPAAARGCGRADGAVGSPSCGVFF